MKNMLIIFLISLLFYGVALAQDSASFTVSCVIPAIPGVNAPLIEEKSVKTENVPQIKEEIQLREEKKEENPKMILQEDSKDGLYAANQAVVKTFYAR